MPIIGGTIVPVSDSGFAPLWWCSTRKLGFRVRDLESEVLRERKEVFVCMEQGQAVLDASGRNERVDCLPDGHTHGSQRSIVFRRPDGKLVTSKVNVIKGFQGFSYQLVLPVVANALQNLRSNQVTHRNQAAAEERIEQRNLRRVRRSEVVNPHAGINQDQRSVLMASRSPSQVIFPLSSRALSCARS